MARIERERFGETADGRTVELYTLRNENGVRAGVITWGGTLVFLLTPDRTRVFADVVLGFDEPRQYWGTHPYFGCVIGRYANRIAGANLTIGGKDYRLTANDGRNQLHGGAVGFDKRLWRGEPRLLPEGAQLALEYFSAAGEEGYPGNLQVRVNYTLTEQNELRLDYHATTDAETVVNLTNHSYFNLAGAGLVNDHILRVAAERYLPVDKELIPAGEQRSVRGTAFDFIIPHAIGSRLSKDEPQLHLAAGYDHCWVLARESGAGDCSAELYEPISGRVLTVRTTQPGIQFYSGNFLDGSIVGKGGERYQKHSGLCLETQHFPDSPHRPTFPTTVLKPADVYRQTTVYAFGVREA